MIDLSEAVELKPYQNLAYQLLKAGAQVKVREHLESDDWFAGHGEVRFQYTIDPDAEDDGYFIVNENSPQLWADFNLLMESGIATTHKRYNMILTSDWVYKLKADQAVQADELLWLAYLKKKELEVEYHKALMAIQEDAVKGVEQIKKG